MKISIAFLKIWISLSVKIENLNSYLLPPGDWVLTTRTCLKLEFAFGAGFMYILFIVSMPWLMNGYRLRGWCPGHWRHAKQSSSWWHKNAPLGQGFPWCLQQYGRLRGTYIDKIILFVGFYLLIKIDVKLDEFELPNFLELVVLIKEWYDFVQHLSEWSLFIEKFSYLNDSFNKSIKFSQKQYFISLTNSRS